MKIMPKWRQFSNFLPIFCQISLTETFPIKIFEFFDIFWQISTNFSERKAFSFPLQWKSCQNGANFRIFWHFLTNFGKFLWEKRFFPLPMKIMPKWRKFLEFLTIFDKAPIILQKAEKNSILGGIWSKNVRKLAKMFKFQALLSKRVTRPSKIFKNWQKFSNFKHSFQREWPKPAKFSNRVRFGPKIGQNVQILSRGGGFFSKKRDQNQQKFQIGGDLVQKLAKNVQKLSAKKFFK